MSAGETFGELLRRYRARDNLSLSVLSRDVCYSKSYLSKVENGLSKPSRELARKCDAQFQTRDFTALLNAEIEAPGPGCQRHRRRRAARAIQHDPVRDELCRADDNATILLSLVGIAAAGMVALATSKLTVLVSVPLSSWSAWPGSSQLAAG